ncbi:MAG: hypothetical protein ACMUEL_04295 [Flavobacteriales bacterium Tduv]
MNKTRCVVERTFGSIKRWFGSEKALYKGLAECTFLAFYGGYGA